MRLVTLPDNDVLTYEPPENVYGILAAPPCTAFSNNSRTRLYDRDKIKNAMEVVNACLRIIGECKPKWWALENPVGALNGLIGFKPKLIFHPYNYGDGWTKRTSVWGDFTVPEFKYKNPEDCPKVDGLHIRRKRKSDIRETIPSLVTSHKKQILNVPQMSEFKGYCKTDADARAITPPGFARAFFEANK